MLRARTTIAALAVASVITITASASAAGATVADAQSPKAWAGSTCSALAGWSHALSTSLGKTTASASGDPIKARRALVKAYAAAAVRTQRLSHQLGRGDTPDITGGSKVTKALGDDLGKVATALRKAGVAIKAAPVTDATAFQTAFTNAGLALQTELGTVSTSLSGVKALGNPALRKAVKASATCRKLAGA